MKNVIFLGPPGCGKGTQAALLSSELAYVKVSTGDLLREIAKQENEFGKKIKATLEQGVLVSNEMVNHLIDDFYKKNTNVEGVILDGYPRTVEQGKSLELILQHYKTKIDLVFYFNITEDVLIKRITGRYACVDCGAIYNSFFYNTKVMGKCDKCEGTDFTKRSDDSEKVVIDRLKIFNSQTALLLEYYGNKLVRIEATQPAELISKQIIEKLSKNI